MPPAFFTRMPEGVRTFTLSTRTRYLLVLALFLVCYVFGFVYHLLTWLSPEAITATLSFFYTLIVLVGYGALWKLLSTHFSRRPSPLWAFWVVVLGGLLFMGLGYLVTRLGPPPDNLLDEPFTDVFGFNYETGYPLTWAPVIKMNLAALLETSFAFVLLMQFRELVLVKRTKSSQRNWYLMLVLMGFGTLVSITQDPTIHSPWQTMSIFPAIVLMVLNALRMSWIVFLSFREKLISIGLLSLMLILLLGMLDETMVTLLQFVPLHAYVEHYCYPLAVFTNLTFIFGILYCTTALLSLLFHLPTTSDYQQRAGEMATMHALTSLVTHVFEPERLYSAIAASPVEAGSAHTAWLAVTNPQQGSLRPQIVATKNTSRPWVDELVDTEALYQDLYISREPLSLDQAPLDHRIRARPGDGLGSLLAIPLVARDDMLGALFATKEVSQGFEKDDIEAISVFAAQAALALDNARLFKERIEKERLARELSIAREVQRKLLPQSLPRIDGVSLAASSISALEVGGDYYDFVALDENRLGIIIADVSGKGTSAAFYMAEMQGIFRSVSRIASSPAAFLDSANTALSGTLEKNVFISVIYGVLDVDREELVLARAGHCPAARVGLHHPPRYLRSRGMGLGLDRGPLFRQALEEERVILQPGDVFTFYTDGVVESRNAEGEEYGYERLLKVLVENRHEEAQEVHAAVLQDLERFMGAGKDYDDDLTMVVLKWHGLELLPTAPTVQETPRAVSSAPPTNGSTPDP